MRLLNLLLATVAAGSAAVSAGSAKPRGAALDARPAALNRMVRRHHSHARHHRQRTHTRHQHHRPTASASSYAPQQTSSSSAGQASSNATDQSHLAQSTAARSSGSGKFNVAKNGLSWADGSYLDVNKFTKSMGWLYSWDATPVQGQPEASNYVPDGIQFWPMLWSNQENRTGPWEKYVLNDRNADQNKAKVAMAFNEVNQEGQAHMGQADACGAFRQYLLPLKDDDWTIIGPSTNGAPDSIGWMQAFKSMCPDAYNAIDAHSLHYYGTDPNQAISYIEQWHNTFPEKDVVISEIGCMNYGGQSYPNLGTAFNFVKGVNAWAQKTDWVKGLAFYAPLLQTNIAQVSRLATSGGAPTALFELWVNNS